MEPALKAVAHQVDLSGHQAKRGAEISLITCAHYLFLTSLKHHLSLAGWGDDSIPACKLRKQYYRQWTDTDVEILESSPAGQFSTMPLRVTLMCA